MDSPILIDFWTVDPDQQDELARRITGGMRDVIVGHPGFVSAELYESTSSRHDDVDGADANRRGAPGTHGFA